MTGAENYVGIACGYSTAAISGVEVGGHIQAENNSYVGGVVGYTSNVVTDCTNTATITGASYVGGIAGYSAAAGSVTFTELTNSGTVSGKDHVGGIIGYVMNSTSSSSDHTMSIYACENAGNVSGNDHVGGLFGRVYAHNGSYGSSSVSLTDLHNTGNVSGTDTVAGLIGSFYSEGSSNLEAYSSQATITAAGTSDRYVASNTNLTYVD